MSRNPLYLVAGIDRETLATCPATDKLWAAHLGFSLVLSFVVVLGIAFHASGYVVSEVWVRILVATVVALTVSMFDRSLYQWDWFYQGQLWPGVVTDIQTRRAGPGATVRRFCRIVIRLSISLGLAWVIAVFLELAVFSDTISEKIKRDHLVANQETFRRIVQYENEVSSAIERRRKNLSELETLYGHELTTGVALTAPDDFGERMRALEERIGALNAQEERLRPELRELEARISAHAEEMNAEELGQRINLASTGRAGTGPRYEFARRQKAIYRERHAELQSDLSRLGAERDDSRAQQRKFSEQAAVLRDEHRAAAQSRREALRVQLEIARTELKELEASRLASIEAFRTKALAASAFQKPKDDPLARMTAYQELKNDPKDGATITLFSWMTKFLVIFLEIVPVVAKIFFAPPSVYAAKIQLQVERERRKAIQADRHAVDWRYGQDGSPTDPMEVGRRRDAQVPRVATGKPGRGAAPPRARHRTARSSDSTVVPSRLIDVPGDQPPKDVPPQSRAPAVARAQEAPALGPDREAPAFDAMDSELEEEWEDLMQAVEKGSFAAPIGRDDFGFEAEQSELMAPGRA